VAPELEKSVDQLNQVITDIRSYIFHLRPGMLAGTDLAGAIGGLLRQLQVNALLDVQLVEQPGSCQTLTEDQTNTLFLVAQEALTNVRKHARASQVTAQLAKQNGFFRMTLSDNGAGFDPSQPPAGQGLRNMRERLEKLGGSLEIRSAERQGSNIIIELPVEV
jgi:signal transduction histidine kinase